MKTMSFLVVGLFLIFVAMGSMTTSVYAEDAVMVNINTASSEELSSLKGIGLIKADAIVNFREKHGNFKSVDDLKNVAGIGDVTFDGLKDNVTVGDTETEEHVEHEEHGEHEEE
ncbi:MAG: ComEA family DNA-binding protein [Candidatus Anammoxibacter sp.]